ncbi:MAG: GDSL-type esterase/lipase family protein [Phycisphaerae bacterium]|nr:GDSL-type esterase/lipase family protein [Phycisphaerae bacterium]
MNRTAHWIVGVLLIAALAPVARARVGLDAFSAKTYSSPAGGKLLYRQLDPPGAAEGKKKFPLILFLHGAGGRGGDNQRQLADAGFLKLLAKGDVTGKHPGYVIAPQVPSGKRWVEVHWGLDQHTMPKAPGDQMRMALELVDQFVKDNPVDPGRIYVTGLSMGGFGTWDAVQRRPELFAAAAPVCGGGDSALAARFKNVPIWAFHGDRDRVIKAKRSRDMIAAIKAAGGNPKYTELKGVGHNAWTAAYSRADFWDWMFAQKRGATSTQTLRVACLGDSITFGAGIRDRGKQSYPAQLGQVLGSGWSVRNFGHSARTMLRKGDHPIWREAAYRDALAFKPHAVIILLGTNDTKPHNWKHKGDFAADTTEMVQAFRALDSKPTVYLCRPVPAFPGRWGITDKVIRGEVIPLIDQVARQEKVPVIDLYAALSGHKKFFPDTVHPNAEGAAVMARTIADRLNADF